MEILHVSAECYPMAKVGGLADVVGSLPKYQQKEGHFAKVVMPMYRTKFLYNNEWEVVHKGSFMMGVNKLEFTIIKEKENLLGFDLYCVDINGLLDREKVYGYEDDTERFIAFQISVLEWVSRWNHKPDILHVHDHHTSLIPFMTQECYVYKNLSHIKTVLTIHNAQYQGWMDWKKIGFLPAWNTWKWGLLDWSDTVNSLACGIKCAGQVTTVSKGYLAEMMEDANGLEELIKQEVNKCTGILNGIDVSVWNPKTDTYIMDNFSVKDYKAGKHLNKKKICDDFNLDLNQPLFIFIGRLVAEKAADLLAPAIKKILNAPNSKVNFLILGSGEKEIEDQIQNMQNHWVGYYHSQIEYNEKLSHQMYAGADFLLMPSRVEPCGLNQMYAMRYGTVPIVRKTGGLKDTVIDVGDEGGYGITFLDATVDEIVESIKRALILFQNKSKLQEVRSKILKINFSWEESAKEYIKVYNK